VNAASDSATAAIPYDQGFVVRLGALAGVMKAGMLALVQFGSLFGGLNLGMFLLLLLVFSSFGVAVIVTSAVTNLVWGYGVSFFLSFFLSLLSSSFPPSISANL
jgi:hypothetical protein